MTKKRFIKLLMSQGYTRNRIRVLLDKYMKENVSYNDLFRSITTVKIKNRRTYSAKTFVEAMNNNIIGIDFTRQFIGEINHPE